MFFLSLYNCQKLHAVIRFGLFLGFKETERSRDGGRERRKENVKGREIERRKEREKERQREGKREGGRGQRKRQ